jgi:trk system potassium uptake protein TrkA
VSADRDTLLQARIREAHAFAAVSSGDNSNIIAARPVGYFFAVFAVFGGGGVALTSLAHHS